MGEKKNIGPKIAAKFGIDLIFYGENEAEYGNPIAENNTSLNFSLFYILDFTLIESNRFVIVPVLSSAAKIPLLFETIFNAV